MTTLPIIGQNGPDGPVEKITDLAFSLTAFDEAVSLPSSPIQVVLDRAAVARRERIRNDEDSIQVNFEVNPGGRSTVHVFLWDPKGKGAVQIAHVTSLPAGLERVEFEIDVRHHEQEP
jgi:hypothetical protein